MCVGEILIKFFRLFFNIKIQPQMEGGLRLKNISILTKPIKNTMECENIRIHSFEVGDM